MSMPKHEFARRRDILLAQYAHVRACVWKWSNRRWGSQEIPRFDVVFDLYPEAMKVLSADRWFQRHMSLLCKEAIS